MRLLTFSYWVWNVWLILSLCILLKAPLFCATYLWIFICATYFLFILGLSFSSQSLSFGAFVVHYIEFMLLILLLGLCYFFSGNFCTCVLTLTIKDSRLRLSVYSLLYILKLSWTVKGGGIVDCLCWSSSSIVVLWLLDCSLFGGLSDSLRISCWTDSQSSL